MYSPAPCRWRSRPSRSRADLREFIELPYRLHANGTPWVPPLRLERRLFLNPRFNAFFKHGEAQLFLARRGGRVVGPDQRPGGHGVQRVPAERLGDVRLPRAGERPGGDRRAARGGRTAGCASTAATAMVGPMDFTLNDESGILIEGYERPADGPPALAPALLPRAVRGAGPREGGGPVHVGAPHLRQGERAAGDLGAGGEARARARDPDPQDEPPDACAGTWTSSPRSTTRPGRATGASCPSRRRTSTPTPRSSSWCSTATGSWSPRTPTGKAVGVAISVPDINQVLKRMNGRLLPLGLVALPEPQAHHRPGARGLPRRQAGVPAHGRGRRPLRRALRHGRATRVKWGEMGWILETNKAMNRAMEGMGGPDRQAVPGLRAPALSAGRRTG